MWKEKLGNYFVDVSKYFLTGVFVTSLMKDFADLRWLVYVASAVLAISFLIGGLYLIHKGNNKNKNKNKK